MPEAFKKSTVREYFESIVIAVILALFIRTFVVQAFKIPTGSMENNLLIGDHLLVNKFVFGPSASADRAGAAADRRPSSAAMSSSSSTPRSRTAISSSASSACRARRSRCGRRRSTSTARRSTSRTSHFLEPPRHAPAIARGDVVRRPGALRAGDRAARPVFRDGRQPRQLAGQPVLGLPAAGLRQGQGAGDLLVVRRGRRRLL